MTTYLITWKPASENNERGWPEEKLNALASTLRRTGKATEPWRFARRHGVKEGERVFLARQGRRGHAILGYGRVWDLEQADEGYTTIIFDTLIDTRTGTVLATSEELHRITNKKGVWDSMASGIALPEDVAAQLESLVIGRTPIPDLLPAAKITKQDWSKEELEAAVLAYMEMRKHDMRGEQYSKARYYADLSSKFGRTAKAFEYRMQNISHVLSLMGRDWIQGLVPAKNVGANVAAEIEQLIFKVEEQPTIPVARFEKEIESLLASPARAAPAGVDNPSKSTISVTTYQRDASVVAWVLKACQGKCECCKNPAPFIKDDGLPFLEVHHLVRLADKGPDTITNAIAICPNCHRELHHGQRRKEIVKHLRSKIPRLKMRAL